MSPADLVAGMGSGEAAACMSTGQGSRGGERCAGVLQGCEEVDGTPQQRFRPPLIPRDKRQRPS